MAKLDRLAWKDYARPSADECQGPARVAFARPRGRRDNRVGKNNVTYMGKRVWLTTAELLG